MCAYEVNDSCRSAAYTGPSCHTDRIKQDIRASLTVWVQPLVYTHRIKGWTSSNFLFENSKKIRCIFVSEQTEDMCLKALIVLFLLIDAGRLVYLKVLK